MNKPSSLLWVVFIFLLILPTPVGKFILDLAGGIFIVIATIPIILGGAGWIAWKRIQSKVKTCQACGTSFFNDQITCPICGQVMQDNKDNLENIPASNATIDIKSEDINL